MSKTAQCLEGKDMSKEALEKRAEEYASTEIYYGAYVDTEVGMGIAKEAYIDATERETKLLQGRIAELEKNNAELKEKLRKYKHDCPNCPAFGKHCPHKVNGDPYFYDCYLTVCELEKENAELKDKLELSTKQRDYWRGSAFDWRHKFFAKRNVKRLIKKSKQLTKAKAIIKKLYSHVFQGMDFMEINDYNVQKAEAEQFLKEVSE